MEQFLQFRKKCTDRRDLCLTYAAEKKRDRGALLLHLTPANRLHATHSFLPRRAHSRRRPSPIRFFSGKYRHKSLCAHFPRICSKTPTHINGITGSGRQNRQHRLSSVGSLPSVILLMYHGRERAGWFGRCRRQGFASGIYVCKKHSAVSPDDDCERVAEKPDGVGRIDSRT